MRGVPKRCSCSDFEGIAQGHQDSPDGISQKPSQKGTGSRIETLRLREFWINGSGLAFGGVSPNPNPMQGRDVEETTEGEGQQRCSQVRLRLDGREYFINRLGRFDDPSPKPRQSICAEIWRDAQWGDMDLF